eukprot:gb/GECG01000617.1/.p1 GENE.gb/GECG01000617.1/~~gb/GECG01000617.1/.p1  ORF type:complete len:375 (+),score=37.00 gb/GECG01000617.1/:1-1125(+)
MDCQNQGSGVKVVIVEMESERGNPHTESEWEENSSSSSSSPLSASPSPPLTSSLTGTLPDSGSTLGEGSTATEDVGKRHEGGDALHSSSDTEIPSTLRLSSFPRSNQNSSSSSSLFGGSGSTTTAATMLPSEEGAQSGMRSLDPNYIREQVESESWRNSAGGGSTKLYQFNPDGGLIEAEEGSDAYDSTLQGLRKLESDRDSVGERTSKQETTDVFRETSLRYLGYANEVGECFRPLLPRLVVPSYLLSTAYVLGDTAHKTMEAYDETKSNCQNRKKYVAAHAVDTLLWQAFASVIVPGFTINRVVRVAQMCTSRTVMPRVMHRWAPSAIGLAIIPVIVEPIDYWIHLVMDRVVRPRLGVQPIVRKDLPHYSSP